MQRYTVYLQTVLHVSGGNIIQHQEGIQLYLQHLLFVTLLLLSAAIVAELELAYSSGRICGRLPVTPTDTELTSRS